MRATWLPDVLRDAGCKVVTLDGWQGRGKELVGIKGVVWHHTATGPNWADTRVDALLRDGRTDLAGPLSQLGLRRDGTFVVVADGRGNHNGYGEWGNASIGIEAYNSGVGEPWPQPQLDAYERGTAAILAHLGLPASQMEGHREQDSRKIDPAGIDMNEARARVARLISNPTPQPPKEDDDMFTDADRQKLDAIYDEFFTSVPSELNDKGHETKAGTLRWRVTKLMERTSDLVTGKRPEKS